MNMAEALSEFRRFGWDLLTYQRDGHREEHQDLSNMLFFFFFCGGCLADAS